MWLAQTRWIAEQEAATLDQVRLVERRIDITEWNTPAEWGGGAARIDELEAAAPLVLVPGNTDGRRVRLRASRLGAYWPNGAGGAADRGGLYEADRTDTALPAPRRRRRAVAACSASSGGRATPSSTGRARCSTPTRTTARSSSPMPSPDHLDDRRLRLGDPRRGPALQPHSGYVGVAWPVKTARSDWQRLIAPRSSINPLVVSGRSRRGRRPPEHAGGRHARPAPPAPRQLPVGADGGEREKAPSCDLHRLRRSTSAPLAVARSLRDRASEHQFVLPPGAVRPAPAAGDRRR
ncbi:MAG: hypothetical protein HS111_23765 [Kofleriaceae bacterium]|nr:hypothetical protein [Kofleriaceae bacterium]